MKLKYSLFKKISYRIIIPNIQQTIVSPKNKKPHLKTLIEVV